MRRKFAGGASAIIAAALLLAACGSATTSSTATPGVSAKQIVFGETLPLSGPAALYGGQAEGVEAYFNMVNAEGGVHGRKLKLIALDDKYEAQQALQDTKQLLNDGEFAEIGVSGSPTADAAITVLEPKNVPVVGLGTGDAEFADVFRKDVYNVWPSYKTEGSTMAKFLLSKGISASQTAAFVLDNVSGTSFMSGLTAESFKPNLVIEYNPNQSSFSPQVAKIKSANPKALLIFALPSNAITFMNELATQHFKPILVLSQVSTIPQDFQSAPKEFPGSYATAFVPPLNNMANSAVRAFVDAMKKYEPGKAITPFAAWGWMYAQMAVAGLRAVKGPLTRSNYEKALNHMGPVATLGGTIDWSSHDHKGLRKMSVVQATTHGTFVTVYP